jgi:hypothetical protein
LPLRGFETRHGEWIGHDHAAALAELAKWRKAVKEANIQPE